MMSILRSRHFWHSFLVAAILTSTFFAWELGYFGDLLPLLPRPDPSQAEILFTIFIIALLSFDMGLINFRMKQGTCPVGSKRATTLTGALGIVTLLCPVCILIPLSLFGVSLSLAFLSPFLPLLRIIVILLLITSTVMLWPKQKASPVL